MKEGGYKTYSVSSAPGMSTIAFWIAQQVLAGKKVQYHQRATAGDPGRHIRRLAGGHYRGDCRLAGCTKDDAVALIDATVAGKTGSGLPAEIAPVAEWR